MLYTCLTDDGAKFEPHRNLITRYYGVDGVARRRRMRTATSTLRGTRRR